MAAELSMEAHLTKIALELREAEEAYQAADSRLQEASRDQTSALNRLNERQKQFDAFVLKLRAASPAAGDWKRDLRRGAVHYVEA